MDGHRSDMIDDIDVILLDRYRTGECSPTECARIERWLAADPARVQLLAWMRALEPAAVELPDPWETGALWAELQRRLDGEQGALRTAEAEADADGAISPFDTKSAAGVRQHWRLPCSRRRRLTLSMAAAAIVLLAIGGLTWRVWVRRYGPAVEVAPRLTELVASYGRQVIFPLPDGSWVVLRPGSYLRYAPPLATSPSRDVYLSGEAYFEVAHDSTRPFRVHAGPVLARVLGTRFAVRAYTGEDTVHVVVAEGKVSIGGGVATARVLVAGELGTLEHGASVVIQHVDVARYLTWVNKAAFGIVRTNEVGWGTSSQDTFTQEQRMNLTKRSISGLTLPGVIAGVAITPLAARAQAQALTPADLIGTWVQVRSATDSSGPAGVVTLILRADQSYTRRIELPDGMRVARSVTVDQGGVAGGDGGPPLPHGEREIAAFKGSWRLLGDTLVLLAREFGTESSKGWEPVNTRIRQAEQDLVELEGKRLTLTNPKQSAKVTVYERAAESSVEQEKTSAKDTVPHRP